MRAALEAPAAAWEGVVGSGVARRARVVPVDWQWAEVLWRELQRLGGRLYTVEDEDYP